MELYLHNETYHPKTILAESFQKRTRHKLDKSTYAKKCWICFFKPITPFPEKIVLNVQTRFESLIMLW